jgi:hypothetical protein
VLTPPLQGLYLSDIQGRPFQNDDNKSEIQEISFNYELDKLTGRGEQSDQRVFLKLTALGTVRIPMNLITGDILFLFLSLVTATVTTASLLASSLQSRIYPRTIDPSSTTSSDMISLNNPHQPRSL